MKKTPRAFLVGFLSLILCFIAAAATTAPAQSSTMNVPIAFDVGAMHAFGTGLDTGPPPIAHVNLFDKNSTLMNSTAAIGTGLTTTTYFYGANADPNTFGTGWLTSLTIPTVVGSVDAGIGHRNLAGNAGNTVNDVRSEDTGAAAFALF